MTIHTLLAKNVTLPARHALMDLPLPASPAFLGFTCIKQHAGIPALLNTIPTEVCVLLVSLLV